MRQSFLRHFLFAVSLLGYVENTAAWTAAFRQTTKATASSCQLASSRSKEHLLSLLRDIDRNAIPPDLEEDIEYFLQAQGNQTRSDAMMDVETLKYNLTQVEQRRKPKPITPSGKIAVRWINDQQRRMYSALSVTLFQENPDSPSRAKSHADVRLGKDLIRAWNSFVEAPPPSIEDDEALYRAVFSQETDYLMTKEMDKDFVPFYLREDRELPPDLQQMLEMRAKSKEKRRQKFVKELAEFMQELEASEQNQSNQPKCRKCQTIMTTHTVALQGRLCQVCHAESLFASSNQELIGQTRRQYWTNQNLRPYNPPIDQQIPKRPRRLKQDTSEKPIAFGDLMNGVLDNNMPTENTTVAEDGDPNESSSPWRKMTDPDSGEIFYWNEETEEMRWELE